MTTNTRSKLIMVLISLVSVLAIGCGDSQKDYVFTGTAPSANTGDVRFLLDREPVVAQEGDIPNPSRSFAVDFFNAAGDVVLATNGNLDPTVNKFQVDVTGVPSSAVDFVLTIYDGPIVGGAVSGVPLRSFSDDITIVVGNLTVANLELATELNVSLSAVTVSPNPSFVLSNTAATRQLTVQGTYSNGDLVTFPLPSNTSSLTVVLASSNSTVANVSASGLVRGLANGNASITAAVTSYGVTRNGNTTATVTIAAP